MVAISAELHSYTEWAEIDASLLESLAHFRQLGHDWSITRFLEWLTNVLRYYEIFTQAEEYDQGFLQICRDLGSRTNLAFGLESPGMTYIHLGRAPDACHLLEEALALNHELNNVIPIQSCRHHLGMALALVGKQARAIALQQAFAKN